MGVFEAFLGPKNALVFAIHYESAAYKTTKTWLYAATSAILE
jgi:hypothetical protein